MNEHTKSSASTPDQKPEKSRNWPSAIFYLGIFPLLVSGMVIYAPEIWTLGIFIMLAVSAIAFIWPIRHIGLGHRGLSLYVAAVVLLSTKFTMENIDKRELAALKMSDPAAYEEEIARRETEALVKGWKEEAAAKAEAAKEQEETERAYARTGCKDAAVAAAKFPSKASVGWSPQIVKDGDRWMVKGTIDLMNGLGAMIPHTYYCSYHYASRTAKIISVQPGG